MDASIKTEVQDHPCHISEARPEAFNEAGLLMESVYADLPGFPTKEEQPDYYEMLRNVGKIASRPTCRLYVATCGKRMAGAVLYIGDMKHYGSGGSATLEKNAAGFRLLAVDPAFQGKGIGKLLVQKCIAKAKEEKLNHLIIHSTESMKVARKMYEKIGFTRSTDLDFKQNGLQVYGFRLLLITK